jgi:hypothetical protein
MLRYLTLEGGAKRNFSDTREGFGISIYRPDAEGLISILKCLKAKSYVLSLPGRVLAECTQKEANAFSL